MPRGIKGPDAISEVFLGADYSAEETRFMMYIDRRKRRERRPFPSWRDVLRWVKEMGYRHSDYPDLPQSYG